MPGLLMLVLFLAGSTTMTGARDNDGTGTAGSSGNAEAEAFADDPLATINQFVTTFSEHHRDTLQQMGVRLRQTAAEQGGPILETWITASRNEALREGTAPVPPAMREMLLGFFPETLLDRVRYRVGWGSKATLQGYVFDVRDTRGITLGDVIVFRDAGTASDPLIWAHELAHVQQYDRWGMREFSEHYIRSFGEVEEEAWRVHGRYKSWAQRNGLMVQTDPATMWER